MSAKPARKRRRVDYGGADGEAEAEDKPYTNEDRLALANRDVNRYPVFPVKDKDSTFRQRFAVPLINKDVGGYRAPRAVPALGMRTGATFVAKPLHDPSGEFAIVLYDPTVDDKPATEEQVAAVASQEDTPKLDVPIMHRSLADILGLKKKVDDHPKIPVVIDPRLAKVLRPHQVEGVKVRVRRQPPGHADGASSCTGAPRACSTRRPTAASWPTRWASARRYMCQAHPRPRLLTPQLQCITLMWTLLKQSPEPGKPTIQKCVIACPSSLVRNWANELGRWR